MTSIREYLDFATDIAFRAGRQALSHFQTGVEADRKADLSPVTIADRNGEDLLRRLIQERFPRHAVVGEEMAASGDSRYRWILDPIDGRRSSSASQLAKTIVRRGRKPCLTAAPRARAASRSAAVPLEGSTAPWLQASR